MTTKQLFIYSGLVIVALSIGAFVTAQEVGFDIAISDFFTESKEAIELERYNEEKDVIEYGYKVDHGTWGEEHYYYGKTLDEAQTSFASSLSR